ncbi:amidase domain-containing protein [Paenibacillus sp. HJGM_3]|uniref:amidase domain-containing protein n=1 Tax=Paenibacillus sp. HJGM_3 TaxID=3379816 RepID=UPI00385B2592
MRLIVIIALALLVGMAPAGTSALSAQQDQDKEEVAAFLTQLFKDRNEFLLNQRPETIDKYYIETQTGSRYAFQMEMRRMKYTSLWAEKRGIRFIAAEPGIRITRFKREGDTAKLALVQSTQITYAYKATDLPPQTFGVGTRHALTVKKMDGVWKVLREWYLDPLEENPDLIPDSPQGFPHPVVSRPEQAPNKGTRYNRERALEYANKYAGLAWGAGNNNRYNQKYTDYTSLGGDCTNYVSQVLGDPKEGGGLKMTGTWRYSGAGSRAWVQTDAFGRFLLYSGYGRQVAKGTFGEITQSSDKFPDGAIAKLQPGDVIGYILHGDVDHFSVIVGHDAGGYPLVNSHTVDRYRVPFDLGWDDKTKYLLIHIND